MAIRIAPLHPLFAAEVEGLDLSSRFGESAPFGEETARALREALRARLLLVFRGLRLWPARELLAKKLRSETSKKVREEHYPAPFRLIDLFETHAGNLDGMKAAETRAFAPLMVSVTQRLSPPWSRSTLEIANGTVWAIRVTGVSLAGSMLPRMTM